MTWLDETFAAPDPDPRLRWSNPPPEVSTGPATRGATAAQTDFWQGTHYGFRVDNGHLLAAEWAATSCSRPFVRGSPAHQYDQAGLMVRLSPDCWLKTSVEFEPGEPSRLGAVVTNRRLVGLVDPGARAGGGGRSAFRVTRRGADYLVEAALGGALVADPPGPPARATQAGRDRRALRLQPQASRLRGPCSGAPCEWSVSDASLVPPGRRFHTWRQGNKPSSGRLPFRASWTGPSQAAETPFDTHRPEARPDPRRPIQAGRLHHRRRQGRRHGAEPDLDRPVARPTAAGPRYRTRAEFLDEIAAIVRQDIVDIMLVSASNLELLNEDGVFDGSAVKPAIRANDTTDIWVVRGGALQPAGLAALPHRRSLQPTAALGTDLGLYSITFNNDLDADISSLEAFAAFRADAPANGFNYFLEVFNPNVDCRLAADVDAALTSTTASCAAWPASDQGRAAAIPEDRLQRPEGAGGAGLLRSAA